MPDDAMRIQDLRDQRTVLLTSFRRNGAPVGTPVHIAFDGELAYIRTWDTSGKFRRIRRTPAITLAPSTFRGSPTGPATSATAHILAEDEATAATRALARKYPLLHGKLIPLAHRLRGFRTVHLRIDAPGT